MEQKFKSREKRAKKLIPFFCPLKILSEQKNIGHFSYNSMKCKISVKLDSKL